MRVLGRLVPLPVNVLLCLGVCLLLLLATAIATDGTARSAPPADGSPAPVVAERPPVTFPGSPEITESTPVAPAADAAPVAWSGFAFDACRAPRQAVMDRWRTASPFTGVGIYLGGIHRACEQRHLDRRWVTRQIARGWKLLPIWVGPQASCTGYRHRIAGRPGASGHYPAARRAGQRQARSAAAAARRLGLPRGEVVFYDLEPFDERRRHCRGSSLAFLEEWTREIRRHGFRSGVYSHVRSGIALLSRTGASYTRPDAVWYAWIDRAGSMPREYVANPAFMRTSRVHQYALDTRVEFGGIRMDIDWNIVSLGAPAPTGVPATCDQGANRIRPRPVRPGARGTAVRVVQCLVARSERHPAKTSGQYDARTARSVREFQKRRNLPATGQVDRRTWTALLARGHAPVLKRGARGDNVRRLQRSLKVAVGPAVRVDGAFGRSTARAVRTYRSRLGLGNKAVVTRGVWKALAHGRVTRSPNRR